MHRPAFFDFRALAPSRPGLAGLGLACVLSMAACDRGDPTVAARASIQAGDFASAVVLLKSAVQANPNAAELRVLLADALERRHDLAGAEQHLMKAVEAGGDENLLVPRIALIMLDRGATDDLIRTYQNKALTEPAAESSLRGTVALAYLAKKRTAQAQEQIGRAANMPSVKLAKAQILVSQGKPSEALELLGLPGDAASAPWWVLRAAKRIATATGDTAASLDYMKRATESVPWHAGVAGEYGEALITAAKFGEAAPIRDRLRKEAPGLFWTFYLDAMLQNLAGRTEEAHAAALNALKLSPQHQPASLIAASAELRKGDVMMANRRLAALVRSHPDSLPALRLLAQSQGLLGQTKELAESISRGLEMAPKDAQLLGYRADAEMAARQFKQAVATLTTLSAARPADPDAMLSLAQAKFQLGDRAAAVQLLDRAAAHGVSDSALMGRVVSAALGMNNLALARKVAELAVAKQPEDARARLSLAAVQSASNDRAGSWATTLAVLDKQPANANALLALGAMARAPDQRKELLLRHEAAIAAGSMSPQTYIDYATLLGPAATGKMSPLQVLETGLQAVPTSVALREALVESHLREGNTEKALSVAQTGASTSNASAALGALLANTYDRLGRTVQATDAYRKLVNEFPQRSDWKLRLAQLEAVADRPNEASALLRGLIVDRPFETTAYQALAKMLARTDVPQAMAVAAQLGERPEFKGAGMLLAGDVLQIAGQNAEALEQFNKAAKAGVVPAAHLRRVQVLDSTGQREAADSELAEAVKNFPAEPQVIGVVAQRALGSGDAVRAAELLHKLAAKTPRDPYLLNDLAWAQLAAGRPEALESARKAAAVLPNNPNVLHTLGLTLAKAGKRDEAIAALRASANLAPLAAVPRLHMAQHLVEAGDRAGATQALRTINESLLGKSDQASLSALRSKLGMS